MHDVMLEHEVDMALAHVDQPVVVAPPDPRPLPAERLLVESGWHLHVARRRNSVELAADPHGVAHVLESVRAHREVELAVLERPRLAGADVTLDPRRGPEALGTGAVDAMCAARLERHD